MSKEYRLTDKERESHLIFRRELDEILDNAICKQCKTPAERTAAERKRFEAWIQEYWRRVCKEEIDPYVFEFRKGRYKYPICSDKWPIWAAATGVEPWADFDGDIVEKRE